jgi:chorismate dehydratase
MQSEKIRISAVSFANTYPFIYGLTETGFNKRVIISTDHPANCAAKLINGEVDIGLIPVAVLPHLKEYYIITDFCLGAYGDVRTVMLLSNSPFEEILSINLDYRSRSSVSLAKILAKNLWKREFKWNETKEGFDFLNPGEREAIVLIGDLCFEYSGYFRTKIDLAGEWYKFTGLPFAFACWTSNKRLDPLFLEDFNDALKVGINNIPAVVKKFGDTGSIRGKDLMDYLTKNMNYDLNEDKRQAIDLFIKMLYLLNK